MLRLDLYRPSRVADAHETLGDKMREFPLTVTLQADRGVSRAARNRLSRHGDQLEQLPDAGRKNGELVTEDLADGGESDVVCLEVPMPGESIDEKWAPLRFHRDGFGALVAGTLATESRRTASSFDSETVSG